YEPIQLVPGVAPGNDQTDDFAASGVRTTRDIAERFCASFYWGCEGDDRLVGLAYDKRINPLRATVRAMKGSDPGHWDVPSFTAPLVEAYELVEDGILTPEQFEEFVCTNAVRFYAGNGTSFFAGTAVEADVTKIQTDLGIDVAT